MQSTNGTVLGPENGEKLEETRKTAKHRKNRLKPSESGQNSEMSQVGVFNQNLSDHRKDLGRKILGSPEDAKNREIIEGTSLKIEKKRS